MKEKGDMRDRHGGTYRNAWMMIVTLLLAFVLSVFSPQAVPAAGPETAPTPAATVATKAPAVTYPRRLGGPAPPRPRVGEPVRLKIPTIGVDAVVEQVGKTEDGLMDVPKTWDETAWYQLSVRPGEQGNAVIDGHVDSTTGPAVFWNLHKLVPGDQIITVSDDGAEHRFTVTASESYKRADAPLDRIFGPSFTAHLNLITCDSNSVFDQSKGEYASNLVVYADAVP